mmetsp:Transcript_24587/g.55402  ORF Transcript_24587/g.55402 Transcript_24587/m.55402 type:complete len:212 (+) Transcript_24587:26-661(+)
MAGRGRGKGKGKPSALQDLLRSNADDLDVDQSSFGGRGQAPPKLWPDVLGGLPDIASVMPMTAEDREAIERARRLCKRLRDSPYFLQSEAKVPDVLRWSNRCVDRHSRAEALRAELVTSTKFMPPEVMDAGGRKKSRAATVRSNSLSALEDREGKVGQADAAKGEDDDGENDVRDDVSDGAGDFDAGHSDSEGRESGDDDGGDDQDGGDFL